MKRKNRFLSLAACLLAAALVLGVCGDSLAIAANAKSSAQIKEEMEELEAKESALKEQINSLKQQQSETMNDIRDIVNQKAILEEQVALLYQQTETINAQIANYNTLIADKQMELEEEETRLAQLHEKHKARIRAMEEQGSVSYWKVIFAAKSFTDLLDRINIVSEIARADMRRLEEIEKSAQLVQQTKEALKAEKQQLEAARKDLQAAQADMQVQQAAAAELVNQLIVKRDEYAALLEESSDRMEQIENDLATKENEYDKAVEEEEYQKWLASQDPNATAPLGGNLDANGVYWAMPVRYTGRIGPFNPNRLHPILGYVRPHNGVDLSAETGTPIYATRAGIVTQAATGAENGNFVRINHGDGFVTVYLHMDYYVVTSGQKVSMGQLIGYVGSTGLSTSPHLHFSIVKNGTYVNPANYLNFY